MDPEVADLELLGKQKVLSHNSFENDVVAQDEMSG
ncbi:hypothetical protein BKA12_001014 [Neomicrococcus lactis]|uniref:Uncharacterized protein n=1 Tax=Neomicrococcus lactis TaxID=732241 RepID=A0A7W9DAX4_9MICC|nr:hypothetical protein [Neomicrococcus lactis]